MAATAGSVPLPRARPPILRSPAKNKGMVIQSEMMPIFLELAEKGEVDYLKEQCQARSKDFPETPLSFSLDVWLPVLWAAAHEAAEAGRMRVLKWLVEEMGVPVHALSEEEAALLEESECPVKPFKTPLASAIYGGQEEATFYLLREGVARGSISFDYDCGGGMKLLYMAVGRNVSAELLTALLEAGFDAGGQLSHSRLTSLGHAASVGNIEQVDAFLAYARRRGHLEEALNCCLDNRGLSPPLLAEVIAGQRVELLKHLVMTVPELDLTRPYDGKGMFGSPTQHAAWLGNLPMVRFLLAPERAADAGLVGINEMGPLDNRTALHRAVIPHKKKKPGHIAPMVDFLLQRGADPTIKDVDGKTPIDIAEAHGLGEAARLMEAVATKGEREAAARAAEAELLGLLEQEEAATTGAKGKKQQSKGKKKKGGKGKGQQGGAAAAKAQQQEERQQGESAAAALAGVSLADASDSEQEQEQEQALSEEEAFILARARAEASDFVCPLIKRLMQVVALASDGFSYERAAIEAHIARSRAAGKTPSSPKTGEPIDPMLLPNLSLRNLIQTFVEEQRRAFLAK